MGTMTVSWVIRGDSAGHGENQGMHSLTHPSPLILVSSASPLWLTPSRSQNSFRGAESP